MTLHSVPFHPLSVLPLVPSIHGPRLRCIFRWAWRSRIFVSIFRWPGHAGVLKVPVAGSIPLRVRLVVIGTQAGVSAIVARVL